MSNKHLVSIIVPVYNVQSYLADCIDSIIKQTYEDIEIILVNDGSTDNSKSICEKYAAYDSRIVMINKENGGLSDARNVGMKRMHGEFLAFIDSDDIISEHYVEKMIDAQKLVDADIVQCGLTRSIDKFDSSGQRKKLYYGDEILHSYLRLEGPTVFACGKLYKSSLFDNITFPKGIIDEDNFTTYKLMYLSKIYVIIDDNLYYYRDNPDSITNRTFGEEKFGILKSPDTIKEYLGDRSSEFKRDIDYYKLRHDIQIYNQAIRCNALSKYNEQFMAIREEISKLSYSLNRNEYKYWVMIFGITHFNKLYRIIVNRKMN